MNADIKHMDKLMQLDLASLLKGICVVSFDNFRFTLVHDI